MTSSNLTDIFSLSTQELIKAYGLIISELKRRGAIRSKNVVGDLGESVVIDLYNRHPDCQNCKLLLKVLKM